MSENQGARDRMSDEQQTDTIELTDREIAIAEGQPEDVINEASDLLPKRIEKADDDAAPTAESGDTAESVDDEAVVDASDAEPADETDDDDASEEDAGDAEDKTETAFSEDDFALGESYGLSREEVEELGSKEVLEKVGRALSKQFLTKPKETPPTAQPKDEAKPDPPKAEEGKDEEAETLEGLDLTKIDLEGYDDVTKSAFKAIDSLQKDIANLKAEREEMKSQASQAQDQQNQELFEKFNRQLDELDSEFYGQQYKTEAGGPVRISADAEKRRVELAEAIDTLYAGYESTGRTPPPLETLIRDAHAITFRDRVSEVAVKSKKGRLKKQAARRQAVGNRVSAKPRQAPLDDEEADIQRILEETEDAYNAMLEENGN